MPLWGSWRTGTALTPLIAFAAATLLGGLWIVAFALREALLVFLVPGILTVALGIVILVAVRRGLQGQAEPWDGPY